MVQIDPRTRMGAVGLSVSDLARSLEYYEHGIGLKLHKAEDGMAVLGTGGEDLLVLTEQAAAIPVQPSYTGLYHFALLLPSRLELARTIRHLMATNTPIGGASDHGVSEALYLSDPDGHGIEIYRDRPLEEWPIKDGELQMTLDLLAYEDIMAELETNPSRPWGGLDAATVMGHVHLQVSDIAEAESFYVNVLGFDLVQRYGGRASFVAAGGYHHHVGMNTWASLGAPPASSDAARLQWYEIHLPDEATQMELVSRMIEAGVAVQEAPRGWSAMDPSQNRVILTA